MGKMNITSKISVIIPSLNPDEKLMRVIDGLESLGFDDIIVVNDGSKEENLCYFPNPSERKSCTLLTHEINRGKGAGLKTAFKYFIENRPDRIGVVTVDGDAQHNPEDVLSCCEKMIKTNTLVLGTRNFSLPHVPSRSRKGNRITSFVFHLCCGLKISDTQTGLRAIPSQYIKSLLAVSGERFEYETNVLLNMKTFNIPYSEQEIKTVYIQENQTSHFRPVVDSFRIYSLIIKFMASSIISSFVELIAFCLLETFLGNCVGRSSILLFTVCSRIISSIVNFTINRKSVFKNSACRQSLGKSILRYYLLALPIMLLSAFSVTLISHLLGDTVPIVTTLIKAVVDIVLFIVSFRIQREWVFSKKYTHKT